MSPDVMLAPSIAVPLDGMSGLCHRYPDRSPIVWLGSEHCSLTLRTPTDRDTARRAADGLLRLATAYVEAVAEWADREAACGCAGCVAARTAVPS